MFDNFKKIIKGQKGQKKVNKTKKDKKAKTQFSYRGKKNKKNFQIAGGKIHFLSRDRKQIFPPAL